MPMAVMTGCGVEKPWQWPSVLRKELSSGDSKYFNTRWTQEHRSSIATVDWTAAPVDGNATQTGRVEHKRSWSDSVRECSFRLAECGWHAAVCAWNHVSAGQQYLAGYDNGSCGTTSGGALGVRNKSGRAVRVRSRSGGELEKKKASKIIDGKRALGSYDHERAQDR